MNIDSRYGKRTKIGSGGMADVYSARDKKLGREVAIKVIRPEIAARSGFQQRFKREILALSRMNHPNIVPIYDYAIGDGEAYYVMGRIVGQTLAERIDARTKFMAADFLVLARGVLSALDHVHQKGIIHRDIKPENIFLTDDGQPVLTDFGIARLGDEDATKLTRTGSFLGTVAFASPEQLEGTAVTPATDIYSLGLVFHAVISGSFVHAGSSAARLIRQRLEEDVPPLDPAQALVRALPGIETIVARMVERDVKKRYRNCREVLRELDGLVVVKGAHGAAANVSTRATATRVTPKPAGTRSTAASRKPAGSGATRTRSGRTGQHTVSGKSAGTRLRALSGKRAGRIAVIALAVILGVLIVPKIIRSGPKDMVFVVGGTFMMGDTRGEGQTYERPVHQVTLSSFWIGKYEVTQREWVAIMGNNPSEKKGEDFPVEKVDWLDAIDYCNKRSSKEGLNPCYILNNEYGYSISCQWQANGYRLPTEAEWEYAAKGGAAGAANPFTYAGSNEPDSVAWYSDNSGCVMHPVGQKKPNQLGIFDMSGNVWEWCWDSYGSYTAAAQNAPRGPELSIFRVLRGGSYSGNVDGLRSAFRLEFHPPVSRPPILDYYGFRLVRGAL